MYYNKIVGRWILDAFDYFLISSFIMSSLTSYLKNYLSEKASMIKLKNDIIKKSRLIEPSKATKSLNNSKKLKIQMIYRVDINNRVECKYDYQLAQQIKDLVLKLAVFLKEKEIRDKVLKIIFIQGRLVLQLVLSLCNINLQYVVVDSVSPQVAVIACCTSNAIGFVCSWFSVTGFLVAPSTLLSVFLM